MTIIDTTEIRYNRETKDFDVLDDGRYITSAATYSQAEAKRMEYLSVSDARDTWLTERETKATEEARLLKLRTAANTRSVTLVTV